MSLCNLVTLITAFSMSAVATNGQIEVNSVAAKSSGAT
jgi:hypothetical protein